MALTNEGGAGMAVPADYSNILASLARYGASQGYGGPEGMGSAFMPGAPAPAAPTGANAWRGQLATAWNVPGGGGGTPGAPAYEALLPKLTPEARTGLLNWAGSTPLTTTRYPSELRNTPLSGVFPLPTAEQQRALVSEAELAAQTGTLSQLMAQRQRQTEEAIWAGTLEARQQAEAIRGGTPWTPWASRTLPEAAPSLLPPAAPSPPTPPPFAPAPPPPFTPEPVLPPAPPPRDFVTPVFNPPLLPPAPPPPAPEPPIWWTNPPPWTQTVPMPPAGTIGMLPGTPPPPPPALIPPTFQPFIPPAPGTIGVIPGIPAPAPMAPPPLIPVPFIPPAAPPPPPIRIAPLPAPAPPSAPTATTLAGLDHTMWKELVAAQWATQNLAGAARTAEIERLITARLALHEGPRAVATLLPQVRPYFTAELLTPDVVRAMSVPDPYAGSVFNLAYRRLATMPVPGTVTSDRRWKTSVRAARSDYDRFLDRLSGNSFGASSALTRR